MVGVLFLLNQYVHARLDSAVSDVGAIRYGSGYLVGILGTSGYYKFLHINNLGQVIRAYSGSLADTVRGLVIDNNGKPLAYGGSSSAFYIDLDVDTIRRISVSHPSIERLEHQITSTSSRIGRIRYFSLGQTHQNIGASVFQIL